MTKHQETHEDDIPTTIYFNETEDDTIYDIRPDEDDDFSITAGGIAYLVGVILFTTAFVIVYQYCSL